MSTCRQWQEQDEIVCTCGLRWGDGEDDPHPSPRGDSTVSTLDDTSYIIMLEKAISDHIERIKDLEQQLLKYK